MNIKKLAIFGIASAAFAILAAGVFANSGNFDRFWPHSHDRDDHHNSANFNANSQLDKSQCGNHLGKPIIDVSQKVQNDADSGFNTPLSLKYWAFDYYTRHIQVWPTTGTWNVTGAYTFDTKYLGSDYNYTVTLTQSGNTITGSLNDTYLPGVLTIINGSLSGNTITFSVNYGSGSQGLRTFTGTIDSSGHMSGTWSETGSENGSDTWSTTSGAANAINNYCSIVSYDGNFYSVPGQGQPGNTTGLKIDAAVNQPINGDMVGGYRAILTGTLNPSPTWPTNGNVGPTNYKCDLTGACPGVVDWTGVYFNPTPTFDYSWWGWQYKAGSHGPWVNECANGTDTTAPANNPACLGSSGNIQ